MKIDRRNTSTVFLILAIAFLAVGISTDNASFSWTAIAFVVISLVLGGRWMRRRKQNKQPINKGDH